MGIDIYMWWKGQKKKDGPHKHWDGKHGYLRESYHGQPYPTSYLLEEGFDSSPVYQESYTEWEEECRRTCPNTQEDDYWRVNPYHGPVFMAALLRKRLPKTLELSDKRMKVVYREKNPEVMEKARQEYIDFVELAERMEEETGEPVRVYVSH